jgi:hypothetical protein
MKKSEKRRSAEKLEELALLWLEEQEEEFREGEAA